MINCLEELSLDSCFVIYINSQCALKTKPHSISLVLSSKDGLTFACQRFPLLTLKWKKHSVEVGILAFEDPRVSMYFACTFSSYPHSHYSMALGFGM